MILKLLGSSKNSVEEDFNNLKKNIFELQNAQIGKIVYEILSDETKYKVEPSISYDFEELQGKLPKLVLKFFNKYSLVRQINGEATIDITQVGKSEYQNEYIRIAKDSDFTELVIKINDEKVHEIDGSDADFGDIPFPTIYHWVLFSACVIYPEFREKICVNP